jgi:serine/threonine protein phosphatase PrpC
MSGLNEEPITIKTDKTGQDSRIRFCCSEMQGWRVNMEDSCIAELDIGDGNSLFAVFDGHGGPEISKFVKNNFIKNLIINPAYKKKDYKSALE